MFDNLLRVLKKGKGEKVLLLKLWEDLEASPLPIYEYPTLEELQSLDWIEKTCWYKENGWKELREASYGSIGEQLDMQYHGIWEAHVLDIKERWPKP